jgi:hypothetical protein
MHPEHSSRGTSAVINGNGNANEAPPSLRVKLLFSVDVRRAAARGARAAPGLRWERNGFVLGCAESTVVQLTSSSSSAARYGVRLVQEAKECVDDDYVRSMVELLEERRGAAPGRTWWRAAW